MKPTVGTRAAQGYERALEHLVRDLRQALRVLDEAAADPASLPARAEELPLLQYALHVAAERVLELPASDNAEAHAELEMALAVAREETACVVAALGEHGGDAAAALVWEWRVALFGVRIALDRASRGTRSELPQALQPAYLPVVLLAVGVAAVLGGALAELWPLWVAGLALVAASAVASNRYLP